MSFVTKSAKILLSGTHLNTNMSEAEGKTEKIYIETEGGNRCKKKD